MSFSTPPYTPFQWQDAPSKGTPLDAKHLIAAEESLMQGFQAGDTAGASYAEALAGGQLRAIPGYDPSGMNSSDAALQEALNGATGYINPQVVIPAGDTLKLTTGEVTIPAGVELVVNGLVDATAAPTNANIIKSVGTTSGSGLVLSADCPAKQPYCQVTGTTPADGTVCLLWSNALWNTGMGLTAGAANQPLGEHLVVRVPSATVSTAITASDTTIVLNNTQGDSRRTYFWPGAPITIGADTVSFTGVSASSTTITLTGCTGVSNNHSVGAATTITPGYVAFEAGCIARIGGGYNAADGATLQPIVFNNAPAVTGSGEIRCGGPGSGHVAIYYDRCRHVRGSEQLLITNADDTAMRLWDVIDSTIHGPIVYGGRSHIGDFYGVDFLSACQDVTILGGVFRDVRHGISAGNAPSRPGITRRCGAVGSHSISTTASGFDFHSGCEQVFLDNVTSIDALDSGIQLRCPSARVSGQVKSPSDRGVWCRNQSTQPSNYDVDVTIEDPGTNGILVRPDTGNSTALSGSILIGATPPFTVTVGSTAGFNAAPAYVSFFDNGEIMHYTALTATTFTVDARAQLGSVAAAHANGATIQQANTGTGATTDRIKIRGGVLRAATTNSVVIQTFDNIRFPVVDLDVDVKDQTFAGAAVQLYNCDYATVKAKVYNHPAASKAIQAINCTLAEIRPVVNHATVSTGIGVSLETGCTQVQVLDPIIPTAGTAIIADSTCTFCAAVTATGLKGSTTRVSFPTAKGHYWNQSPKQIIAPNIPVAGTAAFAMVAGTVYIGRLEIDQPQVFVGKANVFVALASGSSGDTIEVAILDEALDAVPLFTTGAVGSLLNSTGHKTLTLGGAPFDLERGTYWVAVYVPVITTALQLDCITVTGGAVGTPWSTGNQANQRLLMGNVYAGGAGTTISGMPAITSGTSGSAICPLVAVE